MTAGLAGAMTFATAAHADTTVTVQAGDTVSEFAQEYHVTVNDIAVKNHLANPNLIHVGDKLIIPDGSDTTGNGQGTSESTNSTDANATENADSPLTGTAAENNVANGNSVTALTGTTTLNKAATTNVTSSNVTPLTTTTQTGASNGNVTNSAATTNQTNQATTTLDQQASANLQNGLSQASANQGNAATATNNSGVVNTTAADSAVAASTTAAAQPAGISYSYVAYPQSNTYATGSTGSQTAATASQNGATGSATYSYSTTESQPAAATTSNQSTTTTAQTSTTTTANANTNVSSPYARYSASQAIARAESQVGTPYVWGGNTPAGFDCSGLVQWAYGLSSSNRTTYQQETMGAHHYDIANAQAGDIYFWGTDTAPYHEALATGNGNYVVAPAPGQNVQNSNIHYYTPSYYVSMN